MKKRALSIVVLSAMLLFSPLTGGSTVEASTQPIMWGQNELTKTQLGRIVFTTNVKVYKRGADNVPQFHLNAKKGSMWRVHKITNEGGRNIYDLGGGVRVQESSLSKYEKVPMALMRKQIQQYGAYIEWVDVYPGMLVSGSPLVSRLMSEEVVDKLNKEIQNTLNTYVVHKESGFQMEITVVKNRDNVLTLEFKQFGQSEETSKYMLIIDALSYNLTTGEQIDKVSIKNECENCNYGYK
ncbi:hypothetical protein ACFSFY_12335 [Sporosarcina siberiensis]|uniref:Uncharacterized protein n=1 Tax=Sporosarcina siberiensis TaxID=1365606 RepID=A0ABW4SIA3_9BACL